jgi:uncharacterized repeat protein (TIGR01451 family)
MHSPKPTRYLWKILAIGTLWGLIAVGMLSASSIIESYAAPVLQTTPAPTATPDRVSVFADATDLAGVAFTGAQFGASWGDYDNDGWVDLFANNHFQDNPNLYHNNGDGTFTDVYTSSGILSAADAERDPPVSDPHGSRWGDYDNDGDLDLYITTGRFRVNPFYVNQGDSAFVERAIEAGIEDLQGRGRTANWIDYDRDGDLDLFKGNEVLAEGPDKLYRNNRDGTFTDVSNVAGLHDTSSTWGNVWGDYDNDGDLDVALSGGDGVTLYCNDGDGTFTNVTSAAGLLGGEDKSWGADFGDYDNDGDLDLYVARGNYSTFDHVDVASSTITYTFGSADDVDGFDFRSNYSEVTFDTLGTDGASMSLRQVYVGAACWHPTAMPFVLGAATEHYGAPSFTPGSDVGVFVWQDAPDGAWHLRVSNKDNSQGQVRTEGNFSQIVEVDLEPFDPPAKPNRLYKNRGDGTFEQVGAVAGVNSFKNSRTGAWGDYNNDGLLDLYVVNSGNVEIGNEANHLYRNNGDGTFTDAAGEAGVRAATPGLGDCAAWADYDHDGFLDLFVVTNGKAGYLGGPHKLYRNLGNNNHWLEIELLGAVSNRQGVGARVDLVAGGITQTRQMNNGSHYVCQNSPTLHFGLGSATSAETIAVTWPSSVKQILRDVPADRILTIAESESLTITKSAGAASVQAGGFLTYTLTVANLSTATGLVTSLIVTDVLPNYTTLLDAAFISPSGGLIITSHLNTNWAVTWAISTPLPVGSRANLYLKVQTHTPLPNGTVITNTYGMASDRLAEPVWRTLATTIVSAPALSITKQVLPARVAPGSIVTYTITLINSGNETAENVLISDTLPVGFSPQSVTWRRTITGINAFDTPGIVSLVFTATTPLVEGEYSNVVTATTERDVIFSDPATLRVSPDQHTIYLPIVFKASFNTPREDGREP